MTIEEMRPTYDAIEKQFVSRFFGQHAQYKKGTKAYEKAKAEFFTGAMSALYATLSQRDDMTEQEVNGYSMPAFWVLALMSGRELKCEEGQK